MVKRTLEALRIEKNTECATGEKLLKKISQRSISSETEQEILKMDPKTIRAYKIKEQVIKYASVAWIEKFQRTYPISGCSSYSLRGTLTQQWSGSGKIGLFIKEKCKNLRYIDF